MNLYRNRIRPLWSLWPFLIPIVLTLGGVLFASFVSPGGWEFEGKAEQDGWAKAAQFMWIMGGLGWLFCFAILADSIKNGALEKEWRALKPYHVYAVHSGNLVSIMAAGDGRKPHVLAGQWNATDPEQAEAAHKRMAEYVTMARDYGGESEGAKLVRELNQA